jgi:hypothetical protein
MSLKDKDGIDKITHEEKAEIIWEAFKDKLGSSEFTEMHFNLNELLQPVIDLDVCTTHSLMRKLTTQS